MTGNEGGEACARFPCFIITAMNLGNWLMIRCINKCWKEFVSYFIQFFHDHWRTNPSDRPKTSATNGTQRGAQINTSLGHAQPWTNSSVVISKLPVPMSIVLYCLVKHLRQQVIASGFCSGSLQGPSTTCQFPFCFWDYPGGTYTNLRTPEYEQSTL